MKKAIGLVVLVSGAVTIGGLIGYATVGLGQSDTDAQAERNTIKKALKITVPILAVSIGTLMFLTRKK